MLEDCGKFDFQASQQHSDTYGWHALWLGQPLGNEQQTVKSTVNDRTTERQKSGEKKTTFIWNNTRKTQTHFIEAEKLYGILFSDICHFENQIYFEYQTNGGEKNLVILSNCFSFMYRQICVISIKLKVKGFEFNRMRENFEHKVNRVLGNNIQRLFFILTWGHLKCYFRCIEIMYPKYLHIFDYLFHSEK